METQHLHSHGAGEPAPGLGAPFLPLPRMRRRGGRWNSIRAQARRRRLAANAMMIATTVAVVGLAALFNQLLSR
jgi:hypothetical protein